MHTMGCIECDSERFKLLKSNRKATCIQAFLDQHLTLRKIFTAYNVPAIIQYVSLDVDENSLGVLEKFPFNTHKMITLTTEHNLYWGDPTPKNQMYEILTFNGYIRVREDVTDDNLPFEDWYVYKDFI
jgi:hypothetical protein